MQVWNDDEEANIRTCVPSLYEGIRSLYGKSNNFNRNILYYVSNRTPKIIPYDGRLYSSRPLCGNYHYYDIRFD